MGLQLLGQREWFGVAALVVAVAIAAMFVNEGASSTVAPQAPPYPDRGLIVTDSKVQDGESAAPPVPGDPSWVVSIYDERSGKPQLTDRAVIDDLDFHFESTPFPDLANDEWQLVAEWGFDAPPGRYQFNLDVRAELIITIDGQTHITPASSPDSRTLEVAFDHTGGPGTIRIEARDRGGPFVLRWSDPPSVNQITDSRDATRAGSSAEAGESP